MQIPRILVLIPFMAILVGGCAPPPTSETIRQAAPDAAQNEHDAVSIKQDLSCSYFYFLWGSHAEYRGRFEEAAAAYQKALVCDPTALHIRHKLPLVHLKNGDTEQAMTVLMDSIRRESGDTASRMLLARLYVQQQKYLPAIDEYDAVLDREPDNEQALLRLGILLDQTGEDTRAKAVLAKLIRINPESYFGHLAIARTTTSRNTALKHYEVARKLNPSAELTNEIAQYHIDDEAYEESVETINSAQKKGMVNDQSRLLLVLALLGQGREEAAAVELSLLPQYRSNPGQLSLVIGKLYARLGDYPMAISHLRELLGSDTDAEVRYLLGVIYSDLEQQDNALQVLEPIDPDAEEYEDALYLQAKILHRTGHTDQALAMLEDALSSEETSRPLFFIVAASLYKESDRADEALAVIRDGFAHYPDNERILFEYGLLLENRDHIDEAVSVMEQLLEINPEHAEALNFVGYTWADNNQYLDKALDYIVRAVQLRPGNGYIQDSLGWVHFRLGNLERAREELMYAVELQPNDPHIHDHLGDVYRALDDESNAIKSYRQALRLFNEDDRKNQVQGKIDVLRNR